MGSWGVRILQSPYLPITSSPYLPQSRVESPIAGAMPARLSSILLLKNYGFPTNSRWSGRVRTSTCH
jgi:hypothetical protein